MLVVLVIMLVVGIVEYWYLNRLVAARPGLTALTNEEISQVAPLDASVDPDLAEERTRSLAETDGIRSRDLVKVFKVDMGKDDTNQRKQMLKRAVKGVSFGIKKNEVYVLLGPNGKSLPTLNSTVRYCSLLTFHHQFDSSCRCGEDDSYVDTLWRIQP